jgi:hypothetical protein
MVKQFLTLLFAFAAMVLGIEGIRRAVDWWNGVLPAPTFLDYAAMASLPLIGWLWWRFLSPFAKGRGQCLAPDATCRRDAAPRKN